MKHKFTFSSLIILIILCGVIFFITPKYKDVTINVDGTNIVTQAKEIEVNASAYYGDTITSTGAIPKPYHTLAVDPKVIPYGSKVYIPSFNKIFIAEDCGGAIKGKKIDIFLPTRDDCINFGRRDIKIFILK